MSDGTLELCPCQCHPTAPRDAWWCGIFCDPVPPRLALPDDVELKREATAGLHEAAVRMSTRVSSHCESCGRAAVVLGGEPLFERDRVTGWALCPSCAPRR
jgi:hypothetical protein